MSYFKYALGICVLTVSVAICYHWLSVLPPIMDGTSSIEFKPVSLKYKNLIETGKDRGSSLAVYHGADNVVDMRGGYTDLRFRSPWTPDALTQSFMLSLLCVPLVFGVLFERSSIDPGQPVAKFLPWFSAPNVTIGDLLTHRAGFPYFMEKISLASWRDDYQNILTAISRQVPPTTPKSRIWHFHSMALLTDGIVRAVDPKHRTLGHFFMEELVWPLGIDVSLGLPRSQIYRVARTYHAGWIDLLASVFRFDFGYLLINLQSNPWMPYGGIRERTLNLFTDYQLRFNMNPDLLEIPLASSHMFTDARNLARLFHTIVFGAGSSGKPFSEKIAQWLLAPLNDVAYDSVLHRSIGLTSAGLMLSRSPEGNPIYGMWDDIMGQMVFVDPERHLTVAYTTNHAHGCSLHKDQILSSLVETIYSCLPPTAEAT